MHTVTHTAFDWDLTFVNREDASAVIDEMRRILNEQGAVTASDLNDLVGCSGTFLDTKRGWANLDDVYIMRDRDGYRLVLPFPIEFKKTTRTGGNAMKNTIIFGTGVVTGAVGLVASIAFVRPVREAAAGGIAKVVRMGIENDPAAKAKLLILTKRLVKNLEEEQ